MSDFKPNASQKAAIELRGSTALVSAGAGSGKTKVLTERLMGYVLDPDRPADIDSFLIITFTRAAAGELRGRIMDELSSALAADPGNRRLRRQSALCSKAQISTIHGFCSELLREHAQLLGISQDFKILDDERAAEMKLAALERVLENRYEKADRYTGFKALADTVGVGRDDRRLSALTLNLHAKMQSHARPELWAQNQKALMTADVRDLADTVWGQELITSAKEQCAYWSDELDKSVSMMKSDMKIFNAYEPAYTELGALVRELGRCLDISWDKARDCLPVQIPKTKSLRAPYDTAIADAVKARREGCKKALEKLSEIFYSDSETLMAEMRSVAPAMCALLDLTLDFDREYSADKKRAGFLDYADLEHKAAELLTEADGSPSELAKLVSSRYTEIMVDEYQDVSRVQDTIFSAVSRDYQNLFMVGDVKQSIYRFRLADPSIFTEKYLNFADHDAAAPGEPRRIILRENYRSRREILDCANAVFSNCMSRKLGDLDYDDNAALVCGASYPGSVPAPELMLLKMPKADEGEETPVKAECEARMVALRIKALVESGTLITDHGTERPMNYGDVAILMRSPNNLAATYRRVLTMNGVPVAAGQGGGFYNSIEISTVMSMLAVIDNPHQDIPLIAVLRSPVFSFTADELSAIRALSKTGDFYSSLMLAEDEHSRSFLEKLAVLRNNAADMNAPELLWYVYNELDLTAVVSAMSDGEQRRRNLLALLQMSEKFASTGYRGLHRFVLWLRRLSDKGQEPAAGAVGGDAVQIMSVHKSKGLEFPVVFLCSTATKFNLMDSSDTVLVHPELGLGPKVTDLKRRVEYPSLARNAIKQRLNRETLSEEMRLMYVALTRPKERLFITAVLPDPDKTVDECRKKVSSPVSAEILSSANNPASWFIYAALADSEEHLKIGYYEDAEGAAVIESAAAAAAPDPAVIEKLKTALAFTYPHRDAETLPSKVTATELKAYAEHDPDAESIAPVTEHKFRMPDFTKKDKALTGTERGIATHLVLQYMDFAKTDSLDAVKAEIDRLRDAKFITEREHSAVDANAVFKLFSSPLGRRMKSADKLTREFKFSLLCDAGSIFGSAEGDDVLMQGVVDCCIEENGALTVIDYKTDGVFGDDVEKRAELYAPQISSYAEALERIFAMPVRETVLYFLRSGKAVSMKR